MSTNKQENLQDEIELSPQYIAGFFDADGSVGIYNRGNNSYQVNVAIANSGWHGERICTLLKKKFNGCITYQSKKSLKESHRKVFWFKLNGRKVVSEFLLHILDYLVIKKDQAILCLEFINKLNTYPIQKSVEQIKEFEEYVTKCKEMKKRC